MFLLAQESNYSFAAGGQYGFLPTHRRLPPIAQWGYDIVPGVWDSDQEPFEDADITTIMITPANFVQWQGPDQEYPTDPGITPLSATRDIVDWVEDKEPTVRYYIYENWPDMAQYLSNGFPPSPSDLDNYYDYLEGDFHDWFIVYHDSLLASRPDLEIKMIPVGPILAKLLSSGNVPAEELYEDDAPHGRATTYFLAGLISYMGIYQEKASPNYNVPSIVHEWVRDHYQLITDDIWKELQAFNTDAGDSRVFFKNTTSVDDERALTELIQNPVRSTLFVDYDGGVALNYQLMDASGSVVQKGDISSQIDISNLSPGIYFLQTGNENIRFLKL